MFELTVGPVLYYWPRAELIRFYEAVGRSGVTSVGLGEIVCSRRHEMKLADWMAVGRELRSAGKEVVIGTQALMESESDLRQARAWVDNGEFLVEANDAAAVRLVAERAPWVIGGYVNVYSSATLNEYVSLGAVRWVPPVELSLSAIEQVNPGNACVSSEIHVFGRMPLALSARCFTARHFDLPKDQCAFLCGNYPDGLNLKTREGRPFLAFNGIQTLSGAYLCLLPQAQALRNTRIRRLRLSPCSEGFMRVIDVYESVFNRGADATDAVGELQSLGLPGPLANGYVYERRAGMAWEAS